MCPSASEFLHGSVELTGTYMAAATSGTHTEMSGPYSVKD